MQETGVPSLCWEAPLEKEMATHSSTLAWKMPWTEEPGGLQSMGSQRVGANLATKQQQHESFIFTKISIYQPHFTFKGKQGGREEKESG